MKMKNTIIKKFKEVRVQILLNHYLIKLLLHQMIDLLQPIFNLIINREHHNKLIGIDI
jgi:hypothetical protein